MSLKYRVALLATTLTLAAPALAAPSLVKPAPASFDNQVARSVMKQERGVGRARNVHVDVELLTQARDGLARDAAGVQVLEVELFDGQVAQLALTSAGVVENGATVLRGHVPGRLFSSVTMSVIGQVVAANIVAPGFVYQIRYAGNGTHEVREIFQEQFDDHGEVGPIKVELAPADKSAPAAMADGPGTIDVMVVYTATTRAAAGGTAGIEAQIALGITETNDAYAAAGVTQRVRLVRSLEVNHAETGNISSELSALRAGTGAFAPVPAERNAVGADLVSLWVENGGSGCGVGYFMSTVSSSFESFGFNVVDRGCATGNFTFGHEMGHNMGLMHDVFVDTGTLPYAYAHGYVNLTDRIRSVMAYNDQCAAQGFNCTRVKAFSNLAGGFQGKVLGNATADAATALNNTANTVANFRQAVSASVYLSASEYTVSEGAATVTITINRVGTTGTASVQWATSNGTATAGTDYTATSGTASFGVGEATKTFNVAILQDATSEGSETFTVTLSNPVNTVIGGGGGTATVRILDDEPDVFPAGCTLPAGFSQASGSSNTWAVANDHAFEGTCSLKSGPIANSQSAGIQYAATLAAGTLSFRYKVSSENGWDCLAFYVDNAVQSMPGTCSGTGIPGPSGEVGWTEFSVPVAAGARTFKWVYSKDGNTIGGSDAAWIDAVAFTPSGPQPTTTTLSALGGATTYGQSVTFSATVTVTATGGGIAGGGTLTFKDGGAAIAGCTNVSLNWDTATCVTSTLPGGARSITAEYSGAGSYNPSTSAAINHTVNAAASTTTLTGPGSASSQGQSVTFTATVASSAGTPSGTVNFSDGATPIAGCTGRPIALGVATCSTTALALGGHTINAAYAGTPSHAASNAVPLAYTITAAQTGALQSNPTALAFGGQSMKTSSPPQVVFFQNTSGASLTVSAPTVPAGYAVTANTCATLAAAATCSMTVVFTPQAQGAANGNLSVPNSAGANVTIALTGTGERSLVTHYYRAILRRAPDSGGKAYWEGEATRMQGLQANINETWYSMATFFYFSPEYSAFNRDNTGFVTDLYNTFFNRAPDSGGLAFWVGQLNQGMPREVVLVGFMLSNEFVAFTQGIFGNTAARAEVDTVMDFYRGLLSRLPDNGGLNNWVAQFRSAQCAGAAQVQAQAEAISNAFASSGEYAARARTNSQFVGDLYNAILRRGGDLAGVQYWIGQLNSAALTRNQVRQAFLGTTEFGSRVNAIVTQGCLPS